MTFIFCLDDNKGMLFNKRRQSSDAAVLADIGSLLSGRAADGCTPVDDMTMLLADNNAGGLYITDFSEKLISAAGLKYTIWDGRTLPENPAHYAAAETDAVGSADKLGKIDNVNNVSNADKASTSQNKAGESACLTTPAFFIENISARPFLDKADCLVIYWWNRRYPGDFLLDFSPEAEGFRSVSKYDFPGKSHEKITREILFRQAAVNNRL